MATLTLTHGDRTTSVALVRNINAVGARYTVPTRRMHDALRRIGAPGNLVGLQSDATDIFAFHGGYFVSFEPADGRR